MSSSLWEILNILTTIVVGFYITHWYSVRDTRTRALKDNYISYLNEIRERIEKFFQNILDGQYSSKDIVSWHPKMDTFVIFFDEGIRNFLPIKREPLRKIIFNVYYEIAISDYFNEHYKDKKLLLDSQKSIWLIEKKVKIDKAINDYLLLINNTPSYGIWHVAKQEIGSNTKYYRDIVHLSSPKRKAYKEFIKNHLGNILGLTIVISLLIIIVFYLYFASLAILEGGLKILMKYIYQMIMTMVRLTY